MCKLISYEKRCDSDDRYLVVTPAVGSPGIYGKTYSCKEKGASVLFDSVNGKWETQEMSDQRVQTMGKW